MRNLLVVIIYLPLIISCIRKEEKTLINPCEGITCFNNGVCTNGSCECLDGYSGVNCENSLVPSNIFIQSIQILNFSLVDSNGNPWDDDRGPDISIAYFDSVGSMIWETLPNEAAQNVLPVDKHLFSEINFAEYVYDKIRTIVLYDHDLQPIRRQKIGQVSFTFSDVIVNRDTTLIASSNDGTQLKISLFY